ncbi:hypothetical protein CAL7716_082710 [Calothrix sp. PCC 7716]|nr:hypothetical protein CAL7716_082710 [Calothrix sp. PCC 7716]
MDNYNLAFPLWRQVGDKKGEAATFNNIGKVYSDLGDNQKAFSYFNLALPLSRQVGDKAQEAAMLNNIGTFYSDLGEQQKALDYYIAALPLRRQVGDKTGEAKTLGNLAFLERNLGNLEVALTYATQATTIIENLRKAYTNKDLQTAYFSTQQGVYSFYIDLLMQSHKQNPTKVCSTFDIKGTCEAVALHISERQRARGLNELLIEAGADIRTGVEPELLEREKLVQQQLDATQARVLQLYKGQRDQTQEELLKQLKQEIANLNEQFENIKAEIRKKSPAYAELKYPQPLSLEQIQQQVLDDDTLLLQYSLGEERSYLWVVSKNNIKSYQLAKGADISAAAQAYNNLVNTESGGTSEQIAAAGNKLSQMILSQAANQLGNKRLLIVGDGDLLTVPFVALPNPNKQDSPLIASHEIGALPSASSIAISRQQPNRQKVAPKTVAVIADPVFEENDPRLQKILRGNKPTGKPVVSYRRTCGENLGRLEYSDDEAKSIIGFVRDENQHFLAESVTANYATVTNPQMSQYRIVHFATHACVPEGRPQDSRIALSRYNEKGEPTYQDLFLGDIFNLKLPAELVVLSACQTGLGKNVGGEGITGFTRGFMYAGSKRVAVSLWNVKDTATYLLMKNFYQKMIERELTPSAALRETQLEMWKQGKSPYYWAGFTIQGEWR